MNTDKREFCNGVRLWSQTQPRPVVNSGSVAADFESVSIRVNPWSKSFSQLSTKNYQRKI